MPLFNTDRLTYILENDNQEKRARFKDFLKDPLYIPRFDISLRFERELALERLKRLSEAGFISVFDFEQNPLNIFAGACYAVLLSGRSSWTRSRPL